jgi:hypothetical protein
MHLPLNPELATVDAQRRIMHARPRQGDVIHLIGLGENVLRTPIKLSHDLWDVEFVCGPGELV